MYMYIPTVNMSETQMEKKFWFFQKGGGAGIKVCLSVILLNFEFIYIGDPLMGGDTHRVCDF